MDLQGRGNDVELESVQGQVTIDGSWGGELHFRDIAKPLRDSKACRPSYRFNVSTARCVLGRGFFNGESVDWTDRAAGTQQGLLRRSSEQTTRHRWI